MTSDPRPDLPAPLVPADCDCTDLDGFMLNVERLMASELVALSSHEVVAAALFLWCRAWKQRPAASLPNDERVMAAFARLPLPRFRKLRDEVLRGFVLCSDGRLYHRVLAKEALRAFERKAAFRRKRETDADRLRKWRSSQTETPPETATETRVETQSETRFVAEGQGQGQGQGQGKEIGDRRSLPQPRAPASARVDDAQAETLIAAADRVIAEHFGRPRPRRHRDDAAIARVWAARGIVPDRLAAILDAAVGRYAAGRPGDLPVSLRLFETDVDREEPPSPYPPGITSADDRQWWDRVVVWRLKGAWFERNGPPPDDPGTLVPDRVLVGHGLNRRKDAAA